MTTSLHAAAETKGNEAQADLWTEYLKEEAPLADCLSLGSLEGDDVVLDEGLQDGDFSDVINQGLLEETVRATTGSETMPNLTEATLTPLSSSMPNPTVTEVSPEVKFMKAPSATPLVLSAVKEDDEDNNFDHAGAPSFTRQQEIAERASLTTPEIIDIVSDVHGITTGLSNLKVEDEFTKPPRPVALWQLEEELSKLPAEQTAAYCQAVLKCPGLVSDARKTAFLEREDGNPALAAIRLALHWELRLELFGPDRCFLPMTLSGAMKGEAESMARYPVHQLLGVRDTAGRAIWYADASFRDFDNYSIEQELMAVWYLFGEVAPEDPEVRKNGLVIIANWQHVEMKHYRHKDKRLKAPTGRIAFIMEHAMPIQIRAGHYCHPGLVLYVLLPIFMGMFGRHYRQRFQLHRGSETKVLQALEEYRLPKDRLPTDLGGDVVLDMATFLAHRLAIEQARPDPRLVLDQTAICIPQGPATKRMRSSSQTTPSLPSPETMSAVPTPGPPTTTATATAATPKNVGGRPSDPRMAKAVDAKLQDPNLLLLDALEMGGFRFETKNSKGELVDADNVTMVQRKNQLCRRVRHKKNKLEQQQESPPERTTSNNNNTASVLVPTPGTSAPTTGNDPRLEKRHSFDDEISEILGFDESAPVL